MTAAPETPGTSDLGGRALRGSVFGAAGQGVRMIVQVVSVVVLARLLTPEDYGLFGMVLVIAGIAEVFRDFGLSHAAVQAPTLSRSERDNLLWINTGIGAGLAITVFLLSWPVATLFGRTELVSLVHGASIVFFLNGLATQHRASLTRSMRFLALAVCDVLAAVVGLAIALLLALGGAGVWALVGQYIGQASFLLIALWMAGGWWPRRWNGSVPMGRFLRFGFQLVATQLVGYLGNNTDSLTIGLRLGAAPLGIYSRAFQVVMTPVGQLRAPITNVAIPVLSRLHQEPERFWNYVRRGQLALGYGPMVLLGVVIGAATPLTALLLGPPWMEAAPVLRLLALVAAVSTIGMVGYWVYVARGVTAALFRYNLFALALRVVLILIGSTWGVVGVATGFAIATLLSWPISLWWLGRSTDGVPVRQLLFGVVRIGVLLTLTAAAAHAGTKLRPDASATGQVILAVACWIFAYVLLVAVVPWWRRDFRELAALIAPRLRVREVFQR